MSRLARGAGTIAALLSVGALIAAIAIGQPPVPAAARPAPGTIAAPATAILPELTSAGATPRAGDLGDPYLLTVPAGPTGPARYVLFGTGSWPGNVPTAVSSDLADWRPGGDAMPVVPRWSSTDRYHSHIWAPAVLRRGSRWLLYVTVPDTASGRQCIAVAGSAKPEGPYRDAVGRPLVCQASLGGSIDPSIVATPTGLVLLWKSDGNCCGLPARLWSAHLSESGTALAGPAHALLSADEPWQHAIMEEPAAVRDSAGGWWLFYSGGSFDKTDYAIGIASCPTLDGPCTDRSRTPYAASVPGQASPGGLETFSDLSGRLRAVFDTWTMPPRNGIYDCCRAIDLATVTGL